LSKVEWVRVGNSVFVPLSAIMHSEALVLSVIDGWLRLDGAYFFSFLGIANSPPPSPSRILS